MTLTPSQSLLARSAARKIVRSQICVLRDGTRPAKVVLDCDEAQSLLVAAAETLGLEPDALDLGPYVAPAPERLLHAYTVNADDQLVPLDALPALPATA